jgi:hypothetical protein
VRIRRGGGGGGARRAATDGRAVLPARRRVNLPASGASIRGPGDGLGWAGWTRAGGGEIPRACGGGAVQIRSHDFGWRTHAYIYATV